MIHNRGGNVISGSGTPTAANFAGYRGTPIYVDLDTGAAYFLNSSGIVTAIGTGGSSISYTPAGTGAVTTTVQNKLRETRSVKDFGAKGDNSTDDTAAIQLAIDSFASGYGGIFFPKGTYKITDTLTINKDGMKLYGEGRYQSYIRNTHASNDAVKFYCSSTATTTTYLNNCAIEGLTVFRDTAATTGAGVRLIQCNGFNFHDMTISDCPEGLVIKGGAYSTFSKFSLFASGATFNLSATANSALVSFGETPVDGGLYQRCFSSGISDFKMSASKKTETLIYISSGDGLQFSNAYVAFGANSHIKAKAARDGSYISNVTFDGIYFDGASGSGGTGIIVDVPDDGFTTSYVYDLNFASCSLCNGASGGVLIRKEKASASFNGCIMTNHGSWVIDALGVNTFSNISVTNCKIGTVSADGGIKVNKGKSLTIVGNSFYDITGTGISTSGAIKYGGIGKNSFSNVTTDCSDSATWTDVDGMADTFTPALTFATPGDVSVTYSTQYGRSVREGKLVHVALSVETSAFTHTTAAGNLQITGLPIPATASTTICSGSMAFGGITKAGYTQFVPKLFSSGTAIVLRASGSGVAESYVDAADMPTGGTVTLNLNITYESDY